MWSKQLGDKIRIAMIENRKPDGKRWSQSKICEKLKINKNVFSRFLNGEGGLPDDKITDIAKLLDSSFRIDQDGIDYLINPNGKSKYQPMIRDDKKTYVIKDSRSDYYKIGNSVDLYGREKALYHEVPSIEILFTFDYMIELHLHYYFKTKRLRGEWFALDSSDIELLSSLQDLPSQEVVEKLPCWDLLITEDVRRIFKLELKKIGEGKKYLAEKMGISTSSLNFYWRLSKTIREDVLLRILEIIDTRIEIKDFEGGSIILNEGGLNVHKIELSNLAPVGLIGNNTPPYIETEQITPNQLTFYTGRNLFPSDMFCPCQMCNDFFENGLFIRSIDDAKRYAKIAKGKGIVFFINKKQRTGWTTSRDLFKVA